MKVLLLYDILKAPLIDGERSSKKETLKALKLPFTDALLQYRHYSKLVNSFTTPLAEWISKKDNKLHADFNQLGKEENNVRTGRFSSSDPNLQQIPSHGDDMRMMFKASTEYHDIDIQDNYFVVPYTDDVLTINGWKKVKELTIGDTVCNDEKTAVIKDIKIEDQNYYLYV